MSIDWDMAVAREDEHWHEMFDSQWGEEPEDDESLHELW